MPIFNAWDVFGDDPYMPAGILEWNKRPTVAQPCHCRTTECNEIGFRISKYFKQSK